MISLAGNDAEESMRTVFIRRAHALFMRCLLV